MDILFILLSLLFYSLGCYFYRRSVSSTNKFINFFLLLFFTLLTLFSISYLIANWFTGAGFDDSVFFHLSVGFKADGLKGTGYSEFIGVIAAAIVVIIMISFALYGLWRLLTATITIEIKLYRTLIAVFCLAIATFINPAYTNLYSHLTMKYSSQGFYENLVIPPLAKSNLVKKKNFLYIYLESIERTYLDNQLFPAMLPNLNRLEEHGVAYTNIEQTIGTNWTIAGIIGSQCGIPLLSLFTNTTFVQDSFLPDAICLTDILANDGYYLSFIEGADLKFAGTDLFFNNHNISEMMGKQDLLPRLDDPEYLSAWGLYDDSLFEFTYDELLKLNQKDQPFGMFMINLDTHQPKGHISKPCENVVYGDGKNSLLNAMHCTDMLLGKFIDKIKQSPMADDLVIIIGSDHYSPVNSISTPLVKNAVRRNLFIVIDPATTEPKKISRSGSTLDIAPTILSYLDYPVESIAFGRDLNSDNVNLLEKYGNIDELNHQLYLWRELFSRFSGYPEIKDKITINRESKHIMVGETRFTFPVVIPFDGTGKIKDIWYSHPDKFKTDASWYLINSVNHSQHFIWVDHCSLISALDSSLPNDNLKQCYFLGQFADPNSQSGVLDEEITEIFTQLTSEQQFDFALANRRLANIRQRNQVIWDNINPEINNDLIFQPFTVISSGDHSANQLSAVGSIPITKSGVLLYQLKMINDNTTLHVNELATLNICDKENNTTINDIINQQNQDDTLVYVLVANQLPECKINTDLFSQLKLNTANKLSAGIPYLALLSTDKKVLYEKIGSSEQTIAVSVI